MHSTKKSVRLFTSSFRTQTLFYKFFVNFLHWGSVFCLWTFATLLGFNTRPRASAVAVDPQQIVIIALFVPVVSTAAVTDTPQRGLLWDIWRSHPGSAASSYSAEPNNCRIAHHESDARPRTRVDLANAQVVRRLVRLSGTGIVALSNVRQCKAADKRGVGQRMGSNRHRG